MKKFFILLTVALTVVLHLITAFASDAVLGDVDNDGKITPSDARATLRVAALLDTFNDEQKKLADVDYDNKITAKDARKILRVAASLDKFDNNDNTANGNLPVQVQTFIDGNYKLSANVSDWYDDKHTVYVMLADDCANYSYIDNEYTYSYLLTADSQIYEINPKNNTAMDFSDYAYEDYCPEEISFLKTLKAISCEQVNYTVSTENLNNTQYETYTFCADGYTVKLYTVDGEIRLITVYDENLVIIMNMTVNGLEDNFNKDLLNISNFTILNIDEFYEQLYAEYDYTRDEYWTDEIDWNNIDAVTVTNETELSEEYSMITSAEYYLSAFSRTLATDADALLAEGDYTYMTTDIFRNDRGMKFYESTMPDVACVYTTEKNLLGKEETVCYILNEEAGVYAKIDRLFAASMGSSYSDLTSITLDETKLADETADKITVKTTEKDGVAFKCISLTYNEAEFESRFYFENGELVRIEEYSTDGTYLCTMLVYEFSTVLESDPVSLDDLKKVTSVEFFASFFYW